MDTYALQKVKLQLNNASIQWQAISELYNSIRQKQDKITTNTETKYEAIKLLWENVKAETDTARSASCYYILKLIECGQMDYQYAVQKMISYAIFIKHPSTALHTISKMLQLHPISNVQFSEGSNLNQLRSSNHPFITLLVQRDNLWPMVMTEIEEILCSRDKKIAQDALELLQPVLIYVLIKPALTPNLQLMKQRLQNLLIHEVMRHKSRGDLLNFLLKLPPIMLSYRFENDDSLYDAATFCCYLADCTLCLPRLNVNSLLMVRRYLMAISSEFIQRHHYNISAYIDLLLKIALKSPEVFTNMASISFISWLLLEVPVDYCLSALRIADIITRSAKQHHPSLMPCLDIFVLPLVNLLSLPSHDDQSFIFDHVTDIKQLSYQLLDTISNICINTSYEMLTSTEMTEDEYKDNENEDENFSSITMGNLPTFFCFSRNIEIIKRSSIASVAWLDSVDKVSHDILSKLCTIVIGSFLFNPQEIVISAAINATTRHCRNCPDQVLYFLSAMLYKINSDCMPATRLNILYCIPKLATHKVNTGPVLTVLTIMATNNDLKAIGIRLLTELWLQEERIFPNLLDILERCNYNKHEQDDYQIACSLSIREICKIRPNTYGKDTLPLVAKILAPSNGEVNIISKAAALEGLYYLCEAKVVDLVTVWNVFVVHLSGDHRTPVATRMCNLLSLLPRLAYIQKSAKYEEFNNQALQKLWHYTLFKEKEIRLAAFTALAEFSLTQMNITCLPTILKEILKRSSKDHSLESDETNTNQLLSGQDICNLILYYPNECLPGIEPWITQLIKEDLESLCHADIYKANRKSEQGDANSIYESISVKLWKAYQACNNQTMLSNLAGGLLFAYDPRINYDSVDDEKNCHYYLSMLESALFEITFDPTDWYAIIHLLMAWSDFMNRVMQACIEYHKSQILMRSTSGDAQNELKDETEETLFRVREDIVKRLNAAFKNISKIQANVILALGGLAVALLNHIESSESDRTNHLEWLIALADQLLDIYKGQTTSKISSNLILENYSSVMSPVVRGCAALSLSQLIAHLAEIESEKSQLVMYALTEEFATTNRDNSSPFLLLSNTALGCLINKLLSAPSSVTANPKLHINISIAIKSLQDAVCDDTFKFKNEAACSLAVAVAKFSRHEDNFKSVSEIKNILIQKLSECSNQCDQNLVQNLTYSLAMIISTMIRNEWISASEISQLDDMISNIMAGTESINQRAIGMLMRSYQVLNISELNNKSLQKLQEWGNILKGQIVSADAELSILAGLCGYFGSENIWTRQSQVQYTAKELLFIKGVYHRLNKLLKKSNDYHQSGKAAWLMGIVSSVLKPVLNVNINFCTDYQYLVRADILPNIFETLRQAAAKDFASMPAEKVKATLSCLLEATKNESVSLPPADWSSILNHIVEIDRSQEMEDICLEFALQNIKSGALKFLHDRIAPSRFRTLSHRSKCTLLSSYFTMMTAVPEWQIQSFTEGPFRDSFDLLKSDSLLVTNAFIGLSQALKNKSHIYKNCMNCIISCLDSIVSNWTIEQITHHRIFFECLSLLSAVEIRLLLKGQFSKDISICHHLVKLYNYPVEFLSAYLPWTIQEHHDMTELDIALLSTIETILCSSSNAIDTHQSQFTLEWLVEQLNPMSDFLLNLQVTSNDLSKVIVDFLAVTCSVLICLDQQTKILFYFYPFNCQLQLHDRFVGSSTIVERLAKYLPDRINQLSSQASLYLSQPLLNWFTDLRQNFGDQLTKPLRLILNACEQSCLGTNKEIQVKNTSKYLSHVFHDIISN